MSSLAALRDQALAELNKTEKRLGDARAVLTELEEALNGRLPDNETFAFDAGQWDTFAELRQAVVHGAWDVDHDALAKTLPHWPRFCEHVDFDDGLRGVFVSLEFANCVFVTGFLGCDVVLRVLDVEKQLIRVERYRDEGLTEAEVTGAKAAVTKVLQLTRLERGLSTGTP